MACPYDTEMPDHQKLLADTDRILIQDQRGILTERDTIRALVLIITDFVLAQMDDKNKECDRK